MGVEDVHIEGEGFNVCKPAFRRVDGPLWINARAPIHRPT